MSATTPTGLRATGALAPAALAAALLLGACASGDEAPADTRRELPEADDGQDAAADLALVEERLLAGGPAYLDFEIRSEGAVESELEGTLVLQLDGAASLAASGRFDGRPVSLRLTGDDSRLTGGSDAGDFELPAPRALREGLVLGLTRMGLLHNLARLSAGSPPDAVDGTARLWVKTVDVRRGKPQVGPDRTLLPFSFGILVSGQPVGEATLWVDADTFLPVRREQTVQFPQGEMRVVERYPLVDAGAR